MRPRACGDLTYVDRGASPPVRAMMPWSKAATASSGHGPCTRRMPVETSRRSPATSSSSCTTSRRRRRLGGAADRHAVPRCDCLVDLAPQGPDIAATDACDLEVALTVLHSDDPADFLAQAGSVSLELDTVAEGIAHDPTGCTRPCRPGRPRVGSGRRRPRCDVDHSSMPFYQHPLGGVTPGH